jgi:hypothetical protein
VIREVHEENDVGFFITEDQQPEKLKDAPLPDPTEQVPEPEEPKTMDNFGEKRMAIFKQQARRILGDASDKPDEFVTAFEYKADANADIVGTYKLLKSSFMKSQGSKAT